MATPKKKNQTPPAPVVKGRLNVHKFRIDGYIAVDPKNVQTIVDAANVVNAAMDALNAGGAVITKEDAQFTSVNAEGEPDETGDDAGDTE